MVKKKKYKNLNQQLTERLKCKYPQLTWNKFSLQKDRINGTIKGVYND